MSRTEPQDLHRVLYHNNGAPGDEAAYFGRLLVSLANHLAAVPQAEILVINHAAGLHLLERAGADKALQSRIDALRGQGVRFLVCANTLANMGIDWHGLPGVTEEDIVPSGVAELAARQLQGFAYIHL